MGFYCCGVLFLAGFPHSVGLGVLLQDAGSDLLKTGGFAPNFSALLGKKINTMFFLNVQKGNFEFSASN